MNEENDLAQALCNNRHYFDTLRMIGVLEEARRASGLPSYEKLYAARILIQEAACLDNQEGI